MDRLNRLGQPDILAFSDGEKPADLDKLVDNCRDRGPGASVGVVRCARDSTEDVLRAVVETPGRWPRASCAG